jgi:hypothetical protein
LFLPLDLAIFDMNKKIMLCSKGIAFTALRSEEIFFYHLTTHLFSVQPLGYTSG